MKAKDVDVEVINIKGIKFVLLDRLIAVPAWRLIELFERDFAKWKKERKDGKPA